MRRRPRRRTRRLDSARAVSDPEGLTPSSPQQRSGIELTWGGWVDGQRRPNTINDGSANLALYFHRRRRGHVERNRSEARRTPALPPPFPQWKKPRPHVAQAARERKIAATLEDT